MTAICFTTYPGWEMPAYGRIRIGGIEGRGYAELFGEAGEWRECHGVAEFDAAHGGALFAMVGQTVTYEGPLRDGARVTERVFPVVLPAMASGVDPLTLNFVSAGDPYKG